MEKHGFYKMSLDTLEQQNPDNIGVLMIILDFIGRYKLDSGGGSSLKRTALRPIPCYQGLIQGFFSILAYLIR